MNSPQRLRIAVLNRNFGKRFGGAEHYSVAVVEELARQHEVHVFAQDIEDQVPGVQYHPISKLCTKPRWVNQLWYASITRWQTREGFDIVHSHENTWHGNIQTIHVRPFRTGLFQQRSGWRRALRWFSLATSPRLLTYWYLERVRMAPRPGRHIVASSETVKQEILQAYPEVHSCLSTIPPGVKPPTNTPDKTQSRNRLSLDPNQPLALFVGNDYLKKGLPTLLKALPGLAPLHLAVVGQTTHLAECQQLAQALGVAQRVHFLGSCTDMSSIYGAADFLVHPTTEDTYAMVVLEAMAHGLPVVVSCATYCGIAAGLTHQRNALILRDPYDSVALGALIDTLLKSPGLSSALGKAGLAFAQDKTWANVAHSYIALGLSSPRAASAKVWGRGLFKQ